MAASGNYDFIVVGAGAAGCFVASRLARTRKRPSVLLIEAGGKNDSKSVRIDAERWLHRLNPAQAWGYQTVPITGLDGLPRPYDRGKGLGGSTSINFSCWTIGPKDDHDEIARLVDDEEWKWTNAQQRYKRIESYHGFAPDIPANGEKYLSPKRDDHGLDGLVDVGFPAVWEKTATDQMDIWLANGVKANPDHNSGDPIGLAIAVNSAYKGLRSTAADALRGAPPNLHIVTDAEVARVLFDGRKAVGVTTVDGQKFYASTEVIISCGSLDTPRILMHSGIGPADQLNRFNIPILKANPNVGQHMKDHHHAVLTWERAEHTTDRHRFYRSKERQAAARVQWETSQSGPLAEIACALGIGFLKLDSVYRSQEFQSLPAETREHLQKPTIPSYEFALNGPSTGYFLDPDNTPPALSVFVFILNMQSTGSVTLQSSDPKVPLIFDPNFFSQPYDKKLAVEATRDVLKVVASPQFSKDTIGAIEAPQSDSEADILAFWKKHTTTTWHMMGTARMGKDDNTAVVDKDFKVFGVDKLRVADMSVIPITIK